VPVFAAARRRTDRRFEGDSSRDPLVLLDLGVGVGAAHSQARSDVVRYAWPADVADGAELAALADPDVVHLILPCGLLAGVVHLARGARFQALAGQVEQQGVNRSAPDPGSTSGDPSCTEAGCPFAVDEGGLNGGVLAVLDALAVGLRVVLHRRRVGGDTLRLVGRVDGLRVLLLAIERHPSTYRSGGGGHLTGCDGESTDGYWFTHPRLSMREGAVCVGQGRSSTNALPVPFIGDTRVFRNGGH